jgi:four helix bundle protein
MIYEVTSNFPKSEFRLISQMRGAAVSVFGNVAEGYGRNTLGDYIRFCEIARGSLSELGSYVEFCQEREMLQSVDEEQLLELYNYTWNTLGALIRSLREKKIEDGSWHQSYREIRDEYEPYDV